MRVVPPPAPKPAVGRTETPWKAKRLHRGGKNNELSNWWKAYLKAKAEGPVAEQFFLRVVPKPKPNSPKA